MKRYALTLAALALASAAQAQVTVKDAWVRATVPQQKATGAFMQLVSAKDASWSKPAHRWPASSRSTRWSWSRTS